MPGRHVTDHQMRLFMTHRSTDPVPVAAAKAGFSAATGYRIEQDPRPPSTKRAPRGRRRPDPLDGLFDDEVVPMLEAAPGLRPVAIFDELMHRHPDLGAGVRRTLERRIRAWRALYGKRGLIPIPVSSRGGLLALVYWPLDGVRGRGWARALPGGTRFSTSRAGGGAGRWRPSCGSSRRAMSRARW